MSCFGSFSLGSVLVVYPLHTRVPEHPLPIGYAPFVSSPSADALRNAARSLRELAEGLDAKAALLDGVELPDPPPPLPKAVMAVMTACQCPMRAREVFDELTARGWAPQNQKDPFRSTKVTLLRLSQSGKLVRPAEGVYALP